MAQSIPGMPIPPPPQGICCMGICYFILENLSMPHGGADLVNSFLSYYHLIQKNNLSFIEYFIYVKCL